MYLEHVAINNFRSLTNFSLELKPGMNIIIGDNGSGKTSVMEALATGLAGLIYHIESHSAHDIQLKDIRKTVEAAGSVTFDEHYFTPVSIETKAVINNEAHTWTRSRTDEFTKNTGMKGESIRNWSKSAMKGSAMLPLISYRKATSLGVPETDSPIRLPSNTLMRKTGYKNALRGKIFEDIYSWLLKLQNLSIIGQEPKEYTLFKAFIGKVMKRMSDLSETPVITFDTTMMKILYSESGKIFSVESLSAGYYWILWMFMDFAARSLILNPQLESVEEIEGVVLIDEIDLHLHPKWQWNILPVLQESLPKVQFIVTTHAPIIISSAKNANIIRIGDITEENAQDIDYLGDAYAYSLKDVVELTQGSNGILPELRDTYYSFEEAFRKRNRALASEYEEKLRTEYPKSTEAEKAKVKLQILNMKGV